jgi:hypothetical protein
MSGHTRHHRAALVAASLVIAVALNACGGPSDDGTAPSISTPPSADAVTSSPGGGSETTPIDGVYAVTITDVDAAGAGIPKSKLDDFVGDYEMTMVRGQIQISFTHGVTGEILRGTYTVDGDLLAVSGEEGLELGFDWGLQHGELTLDLTETDHPQERSMDELVFTSHPWERIK